MSEADNPYPVIASTLLARTSSSASVRLSVFEPKHLMEPLPTTVSPWFWIAWVRPIFLCSYRATVVPEVALHLPGISVRRSQNDPADLGDRTIRRAGMFV